MEAKFKILDMIKFVRNCFRGLLSFLLWIILIGCTLGGFYLGETILGSQWPGGIVGFIVGLFIVVFFGGFIATILNIDKNLEKIANNCPLVSNEKIETDGSEE